MSTNTSSPVGRPPTSELPDISDYSEVELREASAWPAIERYLALLKRAPQTSGDKLRLARHHSWLRAALATYFDRMPASVVCSFWSREAERFICEAWKACGLDNSGFCVLALGKLGAEELNLSSDVDLIIVRPDGPPPDLKPLREFQNLLSEATDFGFALRLDFTLRPGGRSSTLAPNLSEFIYHYGYHGEMWERLAYVRMRIVAGNQSPLAEEIAVFSRKFSFRKHLDFTLLEELKALRSKIREEKFETRPHHFHLKLGEGGIRELELFVHALQVVHGGRNPKLQTNSTELAILRIRELKLLAGADCDFLLKAYWDLRRWENRLHSFEDQQNYLVDLKNGHPSLEPTFQKQLEALREKVTEIASSLFDESSARPTLPDALEQQKEWLTEKGFSSYSRDETWPVLLEATALSQKSERDEKARKAFLAGFVTKLSENKLDRDLGLSLLLDFVKAIRAKASFFTLLNREPRVRDELAMLFSISPYLGNLLCSRPELIDEFIYRKQAEPSQDIDLLLEELAERRLLAELISANQFLADRDLRKLSINLSSNADEICQTLLSKLVETNGPSGIGLLTLGKWGGRELGLRSDLDFIFICPNEPTAEDQRVARRFMSRISEPHRGGSIYSIDLRLRPSGNSGPLLVSQESLRDYLDIKAAAWERQAYLRSRALLKLNFHPAEIAAKRRLSEADREELRMIRSKLFVVPTSGELDLKLSFGGLADVEFAAQLALLSQGEFSLDPSTSGMIQYLEGIDANWGSIGPSLRDDYDWLRRIEQLFQLTTSQSGSKLRVKSDEFRRLALVLDQSAEQLESKVRATFDRMAEALRSVQVVQN